MNRKLGFGIFGLLVVGAVAAAPLLVAGQVENMVGQGLIDKTYVISDPSRGGLGR